MKRAEGQARPVARPTLPSSEGRRRRCGGARGWGGGKEPWTAPHGATRARWTSASRSRERGRRNARGARNETRGCQPLQSFENPVFAPLDGIYGAPGHSVLPLWAAAEPRLGLGPFGSLGTSFARGAGPGREERGGCAASRRVVPRVRPRPGAALAPQRLPALRALRPRSLVPALPQPAGARVPGVRAARDGVTVRARRS